MKGFDISFSHVGYAAPRCVANNKEAHRCAAGKRRGTEAAGACGSSKRHHQSGRYIKYYVTVVLMSLNAQVRKRRQTNAVRKAAEWCYRVQ